MKKFNIDEFIWFIILIMLTTFLGYLMKSGNIYKLLSPKIVNNMYIAIVLLGLLILVQVGKIFTFNSRKDNSGKYMPIIFTLIIAVVLSFNTLENINRIDYGNEKLLLEGKGNILEITNENYYILNEIKDNPEKYKGQTILFIGFVSNDEYKDGNLFFLAREEMKCCAADIVKVGLKSQCNQVIESGQWIKAIGKIVYNDIGYYFKIEEYKRVSEPKEPYFNSGLHGE